MAVSRDGANLRPPAAPIASLLSVAPADARALAVAWNDPTSGRGALAAMAVTAPFGFLTGVIQTGRDVVLHARGSRLYTISTRDATLTVVDQRRWAIVRTYALPAGSAPEDVAVTQFDFDGRIGPQLHVSLDYFASALAHDRGGVVFLPDGNVGATGVRAFDDATGAELTTAATATSGAPVDLLAIAHTPKPVR